MSTKRSISILHGRGFEPELLNGIITITATQGTDTYKFIPYYAWDNREAGKMRVWIKYAE